MARGVVGMSVAQPEVTFDTRCFLEHDEGFVVFPEHILVVGGL